MKLLIALLFVTYATSAQNVPTTDKYPLAVHVVSVRMEKTMDIRTSHSGRIIGGDDIFSVMKCEIESKTYGLKGHRLHTGWYIGKETKNGYEIQFSDDHGKTQTKRYRIVEESEEE